MIFILALWETQTMTRNEPTATKALVHCSECQTKTGRRKVQEGYICIYRNIHCIWLQDGQGPQWKSRQVRAYLHSTPSPADIFKFLVNLVDEGYQSSRTSQSWMLCRRQLDVFQFLEDVSPLIQEASSVLTNWRGVGRVGLTRHNTYNNQDMDDWEPSITFVYLDKQK